jgi:hypothetical protein
MNSLFTRREFLNSLLAGATGLALLPGPAGAANRETFSFPLLGDLHFDKLEHHDLEWLQKDKPDDVRQVRDYTRITAQVMPRLFSRVAQVVAGLRASDEGAVPFVLQVGDLVEGLCGNEPLARKQNAEATQFIRESNLGAPFLFTKGNHDVTGSGAIEAFRSVFHPFLAEQAAGFGGGEKLSSARYSLAYGNSQFFFFDAYDKESLAWFEGALARRTARHCFVLVHPPVVPYGARATWNLFAGEREKGARDRLLDLLGKNEAFVFTGHIHKYNLLVRATPGGGRFLQLAVSSVISDLEVSPHRLLEGVASYNPDQVKVEPDFSPATEKQRRAVYQAEAPFVKQFQYADLPGYAVLSVDGPKVSAQIYSGISNTVWRSLDLSGLLAC